MAKHTGMMGAAAAVFGCAVVVGPAVAQVATYTDRAAFEAAVAAAGSSLTSEGFDGFTTDASFRTTSLDVGPFTLREVEPGTSYVGTGEVNLVDVSAHEFSGILSPYGNTYALLALNKNAQGADSTRVELSFDQPMTAFGADFRRSSVDGGQGLQITLLGATVAQTVQVPDNATVLREFFGFVAPAGQSFTGLSFEASEYVESARTAVGMDALAFAAVPEPGTVGLLLAGLTLVVARRRA